MSDEGALSSLLDRVGRWNLRRLGARGRMVDGPGGAALHLYELPGGGDVPLVLLHGVGSSASTFGPLVKRLLPSFGPIVLPEAPAHGKSAAPAGGLDAETLFTSVAAALDGLDAAPFVLYGNSLGGGAALRYAIERPERVRALVLLSPAGARTDQDELDALVATFRLETTGEARAFMRRLFHKKRWWQRLAARDLRRRLAHPPVRDMLAQAEVGDQLDPRDVEGLPMPVLFMWGEAERVLPASHLAWFRAHLPPQARVVEPPHFGHSAYIEYPADVAREIIAFCAPADAVSAA
ncbi:MAG: alpha/beta hydrolase [Myxococcales bacterium]|nr:alpha/beta hydrolase [Myxococcales bacterium]MCB9737488.1 alpha/beta hydrolase [Deltaproteobacteria bacterium]